MAIKPDYQAGLATLANGGTTVTFSGGANITAADIQPGDTFKVQNLDAIIATVTDSTHVELTEGWTGDALVAEPYRIRYQPDGSRLASATRDLIETLGNGNVLALANLDGAFDEIPIFTGPGAMTLISKEELTRGVEYDRQVDTLAERAAYDGQLEGFTVLVSDVGDGRAAIYVKASDTSGDWSAPAYITGPFGPVGPTGYNPRGTYSGATAYAIGDLVLNNGSTWSAIAPTTGNAPPVLPTTSNTWWQLVAAKGTDGTGTGDVVGPASAVDGQIAVFDSTTGKLVRAGVNADVRNTLDTPVYAADRVTLAALDATKDTYAILLEGGRSGPFRWSAANESANVTVDTLQGVYVPPVGDTTGASGAWVREYYGEITPRMFGAVGYKGAANAGGPNDQVSVQAAWNMSAHLRVICEMQGLNYNIPGEVYTLSNSYIRGYGATCFATAYGPVGGFISNAAPGGFDNWVQRNVRIEGLTASGELLPTPVGAQNTNLFGFARGMYDSYVINCTAKNIREDDGTAGGTGGAGFGDEQGSHNVIYINISAYDCYRGFRVAGHSGAHANGEPKSVTGQRVYGYRAERCGTAIFAHAVGDTTAWGTVDFTRFDAEFHNVTVVNSGHAPWRSNPNPGVIAEEKSGVFTFAGAQGIRIHNYTIRIDPGYTASTDAWGRTGYPAAGTGKIGSGLSGQVGAIARGWGRDIILENGIVDGILDSVHYIGRVNAFGDSGAAPPSSLTTTIFKFDGLEFVRGGPANIVDCVAGQASAQTQGDYTGVTLFTTLTGGTILGANAAGLTAMGVELRSRFGGVAKGTMSLLDAAGQGIPASPTTEYLLKTFNLRGGFVHTGDYTVTGNVSASGNVSAGSLGNLSARAFSLTGQSTGFTYDGIIRTSIPSSLSSAHHIFYNNVSPNANGQIVTVNAATQYLTTSDERLKENFVELDAGEIIDLIKTYSYDWKSGGSGYGVKAQEVIDVFPDAIFVGADDLSEEGALAWSADYSKFVPLLLAEVKALRARVAELER